MVKVLLQEHMENLLVHYMLEVGVEVEITTDPIALTIMEQLMAELAAQAEVEQVLAVPGLEETEQQILEEEAVAADPAVLLKVVVEQEAQAYVL